MVSDLMNIDGVSWNEDALDQNLLPVDAQAVHAMHPLGRVRRTFALGRENFMACILCDQPTGS